MRLVAADWRHDPVGLLLAAGIFGPSSGATFPFSGVLLRTDADQYFLSFTVGGISAKVQLAAFQFTGTTIPTAAPTLVSITFPSRNDGLITGPPDYLNFSVATQYLSGTAKVALDNGNAFYNPNYGTATFDLSSGGTYDLSVTGTYTSPIPSPNGGNFPAGLYLNLPNGTIVVNVMVFRGDAYKVNVL